MHSELGTTAPVIAGFQAAERQFRAWLASNGYQQLTDAAGDVWTVRMRLEELPHPEDTHGSLWRVTLGITTDLTAAGLREREVLVAGPDDDRLLDLLGGSVVHVDKHVATFTAERPEAARRQLSDHLERLRASIRAERLYRTKRKAIAEYIDRRTQFGASV